MGEGWGEGLFSEGFNLKFGKFEIYPVSDGSFMLDGGAMFGIVPKVLWQRTNPADEKNRIVMGLNPLLISNGKRNILVDTGMGDKGDEKFFQIYKIDRKEDLLTSLKRLGILPDDINIVINTHLHFDHTGGNTIKNERGEIVPRFPKARYFIQKGEWQNALNPNERTKASYIFENFQILDITDQLILIEGDTEIEEGIRIIKTPGHTRHHQSVLIESEGQKAIYLGDLIPTTSHIHHPYIMSYDLFPLVTLKTKKEILNRALKEDWLLIFEHDPLIKMCYITKKDERFKIDEERLIIR
ncbi:MAG: MBL fold metallo-hydrolase [Nitrospinae bacterium]|nr:MBL fold metallo-hydrolase [Nitrospinota bacterium]